MTDPIQSAFQFWQDGQASLFDFAITAAGIVGNRDGGTERLARLIRRSVDTVETYAKGGQLWKDLLAQYPSDSEILRDALEISFWNVTGRIYAAKVINLEGAKHWLEEAKTNKMTVEELRNRLPAIDAKQSPFTRAMKRLRNLIEKELIKAPALQSNMNDKEYKRMLRVAGVMLKITERYT